MWWFENQIILESISKLKQNVEKFLIMFKKFQWCFHRSLRDRFTKKNAVPKSMSLGVYCIYWKTKIWFPSWIIFYKKPMVWILQRIIWMEFYHLTYVRNQSCTEKHCDCRRFCWFLTWHLEIFKLLSKICKMKVNDFPNNEGKN